MGKHGKKKSPRDIRDILNKIEKELDNIHVIITSNLDMGNDEIANLNEELCSLSPQIIEALKDLKNVYDFDFAFYFGLLMIIFAVNFGGNIFGILSLGQNMFLLSTLTFLLSKYFNAAFNRKNMASYISETIALAKDLNRRISIYDEVLGKRKVRNTVLGSTKDLKREDNLIEIASKYIDMCIEEPLALKYIPDFLKEAMILVLQDDLGSTSNNLNELLSVAWKKINDSAYKRKNYLKI